MATPITITDSSASISTTEYSLPAAGTTLTAQTTKGAMQTMIDFAAMVAGDQYRIRVYETINAGSQLVIFEAVVTGVQPGPYVTPVFYVGNGWNVTVQRTAGSDRTIKWSIRQNVGDVNVATWLGTAPNSLSSGRVDASVGAMAANTLTASALATDAVTEIVAAVWAFVIEGTETITEAWRLVRAVVVGRASGLEGATPTFRDNANTKNRVVASYASGTRTITSTDAT